MEWVLKQTIYSCGGSKISVEKVQPDRVIWWHSSAKPWWGSALGARAVKAFAVQSLTVISCGTAEGV